MHRAFTFPEVLVLLVLVVFGGVWVWSAFIKPRPNRAGNSGCQTNLKYLSIGLLQYTQDWDDRLPPARSTSSFGWAYAVYPYLQSAEFYQCPLARKPLVMSGPTLTLSSDFFYNRCLSRLPLNKVANPAATIWAGDGIDNAPTWTSLSQLPTDAATNFASPAQRHLTSVGEGANYAFADGHVKWLLPTKIAKAASKPDGLTPTFLVR